MEKFNSPKKGLWTDFIPEEHPEDLVSYALNATVRGSGMHNYQTQEGNVENALCPYDFIGAIVLPDDRTVVFSTNDVDSEIGVIQNEKYTTLINTPCLNFNKKHLIKSNYRLVLGCEFIIYFYDNYNPDRVINIDQLDVHKDKNGNWDCDTMRLQAKIDTPSFSNFRVYASGGSLEVGKYHFAVELLDSNLNSLGFSPISKGVNIYEGTSYNQIRGEYNIEARPNEGIPKITKSIAFQINNVKSKYVRVYVITKTAGDGITASVYSKDRIIPVTSETISYRFTGITEVDARESIDKIVVGNAFYERSAAQEIIDNRLVRANVTEQSIDYSGFQRHANTYAVDAIVQSRDWSDKSFNFTSDYLGRSDSKNPIDYQTGIANEVYALGVVFVFKQGFNSPVFHIPGRSKLANEEGTFVLNSSNYELFGHLGEVGEIIPVWKAFFNNDYNPNAPVNTAYYECTNVLYPEIKDCTGLPVFGDLAGTPIRHHKLPSRGKNLPLYDKENNTVNFLGFSINKTEDYPHPDIIDHFYVRGIPQTQDSIVEDCGYISFKTYEVPLYNNNYFGGSLLSYRIDNNDLKERLIGFISPKVLSNNPSFGEYMRIDSSYRSTDSVTDPSTSGNEAQGEYEFGSMFHFYNTVEPVINRHYRLEKYVYATRKNTFILPEDSNIFYDEFGTDIIVGNELNDLFILETTIPIDYDFLYNNFLYVSIMNNNNAYSNLFGITYQRMTNGFELGGYLSTFSYKYAQVISYASQNTKPKKGQAQLFTFITESKINIGLRQSDFSPIYYSPSKWLEVKDTFNNSIFDTYFKDGVPYSQALPEHWNFNPDYSDEDLRQYLFPLPITYKYCSKCYGEFPNRIIYSGVSFGEESNDNFRVYLNEDYIHVGETPITNLRFANGMMYVHTEKSLFFLQPNPRMVETNADNVYIGTGEFLSIPPVELSRTVHGYAGCLGRHHLLGTEMGWFFADQKRGKVFLGAGQQMEELSSVKYGMSEWLLEHLPSKLKTQIPEYPNTDSPYYVGLIAGYDPYNKRYILTKKDYEVLNYGGLLSNSVYIPKHVYYDNVNDVFYANDGFRMLRIELGDPRYFANRSWTLSFSLEIAKWESFHSFIPNHMHYDSLRLYSAIDNQLWKHDGETGKYYGEKKPFIVEIIITNITASLLERVLWYSRTEDGNQLLDFPTFDQMIVYTEMQSTGLLQLKAPSSNKYSEPWNKTIKTVNKFRDLYTVSGMRNMATSEQVYTDDWNAIKDYYPIDKMPINIDELKSQYLQEPIRGKAIRVRFIYNNNKKLLFNVSVTQNKNSLR